MMQNIDAIKIRGARTHNLKNIDLDIPKNKLTVFTGLSGSGKSSLAFDTIYAEGQRRYVESLSAYARQFLGLMDKPDVDLIEGLQPAISIDQKTAGHNPRSTVGTVTEIYDYLRLLFARVGHPRSPISGKRLEKQTVQQIVDRILDLSSALNKESVKVMILAPIIKNRKGTYEELFNRLLSQGYIRVRVDGKIYNLEEEIKLDRYVKHMIELVIDRVVIDQNSKDDKDFIKRLTDSIELTLNQGEGELLVNLVEAEQLTTDQKKKLNLRENGDIFFSEKLVDPDTGESFPEIEPHSFSFNSPHGACPVCNGLGTIKEIDQSTVYNPRLTVMEGGLFPWARVIESPGSFTYNLIVKVAKDKKIDLRKPIGQLPKEHLNILLYGLKGKKYTIDYTNSAGEDKVYKVSFEGVIPNLERRYQETDSDYIRKEIEQYMIEKNCPECNGHRLRKESLSVTIHGKNIVDITSMSINEAFTWVEHVKNNKVTGSKTQSKLTKDFGFASVDEKDDLLTDQEREIGKQIFREILLRLQFLLSVGLDYLSLNRSARTLSGGESQRIRLASQIGTGLTGVLYVLDEPSIGLHQRDNDRLISTLENLRDIGNTVIVVEHDQDTINKADYVVDIGPLAGEHGGKIVATGTPKEILNAKNSLTAAYLSGKKKIDKYEIYDEIKKLDTLNEIDIKKLPKKGEHMKGNGENIVITKLEENNLKGFDLEIPLGKFVCVTGVSGSGKSTTVNEIMTKAIARELNGNSEVPGKFKSITGLSNIDKLVRIDQSPIGRTPRSNPATYTGVFTDIRTILAQTKEAKARGYKAGRFSFNVKGGRCEKCEGAGVIQISMQFLPDVYVKCDACDGKRYNRETLQIDYKGKNIADILDMTIEEGLEFFSSITKIASKLQTLMDVGLGYIRLGQAATTLSGGESQRVKLASELSKRSTGKTLYVLDEPTTGLHFEDVRKLLIVLHGLVVKGNTVVVIEHNLDVIKTADWIIDLGPEGGDKGGYIVAMGTPEEVAKTQGSYTGEWLAKVL
ncbi:MAG: excinuclease ABC subunit UvrA [Candidatus Dojkabacteria bacterium]